MDKYYETEGVVFNRQHKTAHMLHTKASFTCIERQNKHHRNFTKQKFCNYKHHYEKPKHSKWDMSNFLVMQDRETMLLSTHIGM